MTWTRTLGVGVYWRIARCLLYGCAPMTKSKTLNELKYPWICRVIDIVGETLSPCSVPNREKVENFSVPLMLYCLTLTIYGTILKGRGL